MKRVVTTRWTPYVHALITSPIALQKVRSVPPLLLPNHPHPELPSPCSIEYMILKGAAESRDLPQNSKFAKLSRTCRFDRICVAVRHRPIEPHSPLASRHVLYVCTKPGKCFAHRTRELDAQCQTETQAHVDSTTCSARHKFARRVNTAIYLRIIYFAKGERQGAAT